MLRILLSGIVGVLALSSAHAAMDVRHSEGVELITGRPAVAVPSRARPPDTGAGSLGTKAGAHAQQDSSANPRTAQRKRNATGLEPLRPGPEQAGADDDRLDDRLPVRDNVSILPDTAEDASDDGSPKDGAAPVRKRLRVTEAVLQDQIAAYNRALLEQTPPEKLAPLEEAISHTLDRIDVLVRNTRVPQP